MEVQHAFPGPIFKGGGDLTVPLLGIAHINWVGKAVPFQKGFVQHITIDLESRIAPWQHL